MAGQKGHYYPPSCLMNKAQEVEGGGGWVGDEHLLSAINTKDRYQKLHILEETLKSFVGMWVCSVSNYRTCRCHIFVLIKQ